MIELVRSAKPLLAAFKAAPLIIIRGRTSDSLISRAKDERDFYLVWPSVL